jgi:hypothetical protein
MTFENAAVKLINKEFFRTFNTSTFIKRLTKLFNVGSAGKGLRPGVKSSLLILKAPPIDTIMG